MKFYLSILFLVLVSVPVLAQDAGQPVLVSYQKVKKLVLKKEFENVPQQVRNFHARGRINVLIDIDTTGVPTRVQMLSGFNRVPFMKDYVEATAANWRFRPLTVDGKKKVYRGVVSAVFWYGAFLEKAPY